jgi:EAL domain-containing protein (putative c-di-GMP-specific phosphodiesterase class I)
LEDIIDVDIREFIYDNFVDPDIAKRVTFEILESEVNSYDEMEEFINFLSDKGISFAIDDFGSGYSNFARVLKLKVDYIKIDGSIIKNIDHDENSRIILETLVDFAKRTNLKSVAEFIHNKEVFEIAKDIGVEYFQGFYLGEPVPLDKIKV